MIVFIIIIFSNQFSTYIHTENGLHVRKKQKQLERINYLVKNYRGTLYKNGKEDGLQQTKSDVYSFTPQGFKYENKRYKYIKYTKHNKVNILNYLLQFFTKIKILTGW